MQTWFLYPIALTGFSLLALPLIFHLLNRQRARRFYFPTLRYLGSTPTSSLRPKRITNWPLLLLRLLIFSLIVLAAAHPYRLPFAAIEQTIVLIDTSASMGAEPGWQDMIDKTRTTLSQQTAETQTAVLSFDSRGKIVVDLASKAEVLRRFEQAVNNGFQAGGAEMDWAGCARFINGFIGKLPPGIRQVYIVSDFQRSNFSTELTRFGIESAQITPIAIDSPASRAFVTAPIMENHDGKISLAGSLVSEQVTDIGLESHYTPYRIELPAIAATPVEAIDPGTGVAVKVGVSGDQIIGQVAIGFANSKDTDRRPVYFAFNQPQPITAILAQPSPSPDQREAWQYLEAALATLHEGDTHGGRLIGEIRPSTAKGIPSDFTLRAEHPLLITDLNQLDSDSGIERLVEFTKRGGCVWLFAMSAQDLVKLNQELNQHTDFFPILRLATTPQSDQAISVRGDSPLIAKLSQEIGVQLEATTFRRQFDVAAAPSTKTLLRYEDEAPAILERKIGDGKIVFFNLPITRKSTNLVTKAAFPILLGELLATGDYSSMYTIGKDVDQERFAAVLQSIGQTSTVELIDSGERGATARFDDSDLAGFPPGLYRIREGAAVKVSAINQAEKELHPGSLSEAERNRFFLPKESSTCAPASRYAGSAKTDTAWKYLLIAAIILLVGELAVTAYARRGHRSISVAANAE